MTSSSSCRFSPPLIQPSCVAGRYAAWKRNFRSKTAAALFYLCPFNIVGAANKKRSEPSRLLVVRTLAQRRVGKGKTGEIWEISKVGGKGGPKCRESWMPRDPVSRRTALSCRSPLPSVAAWMGSVAIVLCSAVKAMASEKCAVLFGSIEPPRVGCSLYHRLACRSIGWEQGTHTSPRCAVTNFSHAVAAGTFLQGRSSRKLISADASQLRRLARVFYQS